jgi:hypothetical protein
MKVGGRVGGVEARRVENERGLSLRGRCGGVATLTPALEARGRRGLQVNQERRWRLGRQWRRKGRTPLLLALSSGPLRRRN